MTITRHSLKVYGDDTEHQTVQIDTPVGKLSVTAQTWHNVEEPDEDEIVLFVDDLKTADAIRVVDGRGRTYRLNLTIWS